MSEPRAGVERLADLATAAVREHGDDWARVRDAIRKALSGMSSEERQRLDQMIVQGTQTIMPDDTPRH